MTYMPAVKFIDETGTPYGTKQVQNIPRTVSTRYSYAISKGWIPGHDPVCILGERQGVAAVVNGEDVWQGTAARRPDPAAGGEQMTLVSTSANDAAAGTGVRTVMVHYLDNTGAEQEESVTLNGLTGVNTVATNIAWIIFIHAKTVGSTGVAEGDITIHKLATPATVYDIIKAGGNNSLSCAYKVPAGKTLFVPSWFASVVGNKPTSMRLRGDYDDAGVNTGVFLFKDTAVLDSSASHHQVDLPLVVPAGAVIKVTAWSTVSGGDVSASFEGWLE